MITSITGGSKKIDPGLMMASKLAIYPVCLELKKKATQLTKIKMISTVGDSRRIAQLLMMGSQRVTYDAYLMTHNSYHARNGNEENINRRRNT